MKRRRLVSDRVLRRAGTCSSAHTDAIARLQPQTSVSCHVSFTGDAVDFPATDVFKTHTSFDCSIGKNRNNISFLLIFV